MTAKTLDKLPVSLGFALPAADGGYMEDGSVFPGGEMPHYDPLGAAAGEARAVQRVSV